MSGDDDKVFIINKGRECDALYIACRGAVCVDDEEFIISVR